MQVQMQAQMQVQMHLVDECSTVASLFEPTQALSSTLYGSTCCWEMAPVAASSVSSARRVSSSVGPRRKLRSALMKAVVSAANLWPKGCQKAARLQPRA